MIASEDGRQRHMSMRYFEDFAAGDTQELGEATVTAEEIVAFGRQFDPQPFHVDEERAKHSPFGGLIASGWHTAAIFMRLLVDGLLNSTASMGSPGIDELRWLQPVRPGDTLRARFTVVETTPSTRRPDRGTVRSTCEMINQRGEVVMRVTGINIIGRRPHLA
jgi:acyl dehydratase